MLILHNLKVAWRNLMKYKVQNLISVLSMAVGITVLVVMSFVLSHLRLPSYVDQPHYERSYLVRFFQNEDNVALNEDIYYILQANGGLRHAKEMHLRDDFSFGTTMFVFDNDTLKRRKEVSCRYVDKGILRFYGYRSAVTGEVIADLKPGEIVLGEYLARQMFEGQLPPLGSSVQLYTSDCVIRDIFSEPSAFDYYDATRVLKCIDFSDEEGRDHLEECYNVYMVLNEGSSKEQLEEEISKRLEPVSTTCVINPLSQEIKKQAEALAVAKSVSYFIGSLILLAALIGYLRMQIQLFWMRRREVALRMIHGAKMGNMFCLLMTEVLMVVGASIALSILLVNWLKAYAMSHLTTLVDSLGWNIGNMLPTSLCVGSAVVLVCAVIIFITLRRVSHSGQGLTAGMKGSRSHGFRNVMLGLQIAISLFFVCASLLMTEIVSMTLRHNGVPEDADFYQKHILVSDNNNENIASLTTSLAAHRDIENIIPYSNSYRPLEEMENNDNARAYLNTDNFFNTFVVSDTTIFDFYQVPIHWLRRDVDPNDCLFIEENFYAELEKIGLVQNGVLTVIPNAPSTIAGTYGRLPYVPDYPIYSRNMVVVTPREKLNCEKLLILPREGKYQSVKNDVEEAYHDLNPAKVEPSVFYFHEYQIRDLAHVSSMGYGAWILSAICLLMSAMSVYSTIALDTRARRKEMAIRKIHGAKRKDIIRIFGRLYVWLFIIATVAVTPILVLSIKSFIEDDPVTMSMNIAPPILLGILVMAVMILLIVGWHIRKIMNVNPVENIAKE